LNFRTSPNPDDLTMEEILALIKFCPVCGESWPDEKLTCGNKECGVKIRVEPKAFNWWMFYPRCNGWNHLPQT